MPISGRIPPFTGVVSLLDMIEHGCISLCAMYGCLDKEMGTIHFGMATDPRKRIARLAPDHLNAISTFVAAYAEQECEVLDMPITTQKARSLKASIDNGQQYSAEVMYKELEGLKETMVMELSKQKFAYIPTSATKYFEQEKLFGDSVYEKFETARQDIKDAGNSLAASLPTASVFHSMRVAEHGLRALAKKMRVTISHRGKACPLEFGDWNTVITGIKNKISEVRKLSAGPKRREKLEAYSNAADHCEYMKDIWRNNLSHAGKPYTDPEAIGVLERVRDFMVFLGKALRPSDFKNRKM